VFAGSVLKLHEANLLDATVIHGDGTTTSANQGDLLKSENRLNELE